MTYADCQDIIYIVRKYVIPDDVASEILFKLHDVMEENQANYLKEEKAEREGNRDDVMEENEDCYLRGKIIDCYAEEEKAEREGNRGD